MRLSKKRASGAGAYVRPADWLQLPTVLASQDIFVGLFGVFDTDANLVALTATGNFTVDWGDGSATENIASGVQAQHKYTYASISSATFSTRGYRQVIITVTPQAGQQLLSVDINKRHTSAAAQALRVPWLDITCSCNPVSTSGFFSAATLVVSSSLEKATILNGGLRTNFASMFSNCSSLQSINLFDTSAGTNFSSMFNGCTTLRNIPLFNTQAGTNFSTMLANCGSLQSVPLLNTSAGTTFTSMFNNAISITAPPLLNTSAGTTFTSMFNNCGSLQSVPALNFTSDTANTLATLFGTCMSLSRSLVTNVKLSHSYLNCNLTATAINEIFTNLPTVVGQTITVTGCPGAATCTTTIATLKGWTVTT